MLLPTCPSACMLTYLPTYLVAIVRQLGIKWLLFVDPRSFKSSSQPEIRIRLRRETNFENVKVVFYVTNFSLFLFLSFFLSFFPSFFLPSFIGSLYVVLFCFSFNLFRKSLSISICHSLSLCLFLTYFCISFIILCLNFISTFILYPFTNSFSLVQSLTISCSFMWIFSF